MSVSKAFLDGLETILFFETPQQSAAAAAAAANTSMRRRTSDRFDTSGNYATSEIGDDDNRSVAFDHIFTRKGATAGGTPAPKQNWFSNFGMYDTPAGASVAPAVTPAAAPATSSKSSPQALPAITETTLSEPAAASVSEFNSDSWIHSVKFEYDDVIRELGEQFDHDNSCYGFAEIRSPSEILRQKLQAVGEVNSAKELTEQDAGVSATPAVAATSPVQPVPVAARSPTALGEAKEVELSDSDVVLSDSDVDISPSSAVSASKEEKPSRPAVV